MKKTGCAEDIRLKIQALAVALLIIGDSSAGAQEASLEAQIRARSAAVEKQLIDWRRHIHQHPELGDQEQRTARLVAKHLKRLGLDEPPRVLRRLQHLREWSLLKTRGGSKRHLRYRAAHEIAEDTRGILT